MLLQKVPLEMHSHHTENGTWAPEVSPGAVPEVWPLALPVAGCGSSAGLSAGCCSRAARCEALLGFIFEASPGELHQVQV